MDLDLKKLDQLWDDFLKRWPAEDLPKMRLKDYSLAKKLGGGDSYTYWLEFVLDELGGIGGGRLSEVRHFSPRSRKGSRRLADRPRIRIRVEGIGDIGRRGFFRG